MTAKSYPKVTCGRRLWNLRLARSGKAVPSFDVHRLSVSRLDKPLRRCLACVRHDSLSCSERPKPCVALPNPGGRQLLIHKALDCADIVVLIVCSQTDCHTGFPGTSGPSDPVNIISGYIRQVVVDHESDILDVDSTRRDIRRNQDSVSSRFEAIERVATLRETGWNGFPWRYAPQRKASD